MNKVVLTKKDHQEIRRLKGKVSVKNIQKQYKIGTERVYRIFKNIEPIAETDEIIEKQMVEDANLVSNAQKAVTNLALGHMI